MTTAITQRDELALQSVPEQLRVYVVARMKKKVREYGANELKLAVQDLVFQAHIELGQRDSLSKQDNDLVYQRIYETLVVDFRTRYATLTMEQLHLFVRNGVRGDYGTFKGQLNVPNVQNIHYWIKRGLESDAQKQAAEAFARAYNEQEDRQPTAEQKLQRSKLALINLFTEYRETGKLSVCPWAYYQVLANLVGHEVEYAPGKTYRTFVVDPEIRQRLNAQAEEEFKNETAAVPTKGIYGRSGGGETEMDDRLMRAIIGAGVRREDALANKKKEVALRWYFDRLIAEDKQLEL